MVPDEVENYVVTPPAIVEILLSKVRLRIIDDPVCADRSDHLQIPGATDVGDLGIERLRNLHGERAYASGRAVNQDSLPRLNVALVAKTLQCGQARYPHRSCLLKGYVGGLDD
jgi:hypothetical protein